MFNNKLRRRTRPEVSFPNRKVGLCEISLLKRTVNQILIQSLTNKRLVCSGELSLNEKKKRIHDRQANRERTQSYCAIRYANRRREQVRSNRKNETFRTRYIVFFRVFQ